MAAQYCFVPVKHEEKATILNEGCDMPFKATGQKDDAENMVPVIPPVQNVVAPAPVFTRDQIIAAIDLVVTEWNAHMNDGWEFHETKALYFRYLKHQGHFVFIQSYPALSHRTVREIMIKILTDHNRSVELRLEVPWLHIDRIVPSDPVEPMGDSARFCYGAPWPLVDVDAAVAVLDGGGSVAAAALDAAFVAFGNAGGSA